MNYQSKKISVVKVLITVAVGLTLVSCAKSGQRSAEESAVLGTSSFNSGEAAPGVVLEPQSKTQTVEQNSVLASFSLIPNSGSSSNSDSGFIPGSGSTSGSDTGTIPPPGSVVTTTTIPVVVTTPTTTQPASPNSGSTDQSGGTTTTAPSTGTTNNSSSNSGSSSSSSASSGTSSVGGTDGGNIPNSGVSSGNDTGSVSGPSSGSVNSGSGSQTPSTGSTDSASNSSSSGSTTTPSSDTSSGGSAGASGGTGSTTVADNTGSASSVPTSPTGNDSGQIGNSGSSGGNDNGGVSNSTGGSSSSTNPGSSSTGSSGSSSSSTNSGGTSTDSSNPVSPVNPIPSPLVEMPVCHIPPGNPSNAHVIAVAVSAVPAHLAHGDTLGNCPSNPGSSPNSVSNPSSGSTNVQNGTTVPSVDGDEDDDHDHDHCSCQDVHPAPHKPRPCQGRDRVVSIELGRVCSLRRSQSKNLFFEDAKNPILSVEAIVPKGRIKYGNVSSNPYGSKTGNAEKWGVLNGEIKERVIVATFDLRGLDLLTGKAQEKLTLKLAELRKKLGREWKNTAIVASVCEDVNNDGSCYASSPENLLSVVPATFKANRIPKQIALDVWNGRGLTLASDSDKCDKQYSPIVLDLTGEGIKLTGPEEGVKFDLNADGNPVFTGWIQGANNAFLVRDLNSNGTIDDGSELFGSATRLPNGKRAPNGFEALKALDDNQDHILDSKDSAWRGLRLWFDRNHDGISQRSELERLERYSIKSLNLNYIELLEMDDNGNQTRERSTYTRKVGSVDKMFLMVDIWFRTLVSQ